MSKFISLFVILVTVISSISVAISQTPGAADPDKLIINEIKFDRAPLGTVVDFLREKSKDLDPNGKGINILVGDSVKALPVTIDLNGISVLQTLKILAAQQNLTLDTQPYAYILDTVSGSNGGGVQAGGGPLTVPISVDLHDVPLDQTIAFITSEIKRVNPNGQGLKIVINPDVDSTRKITITLSNTPVQDILHYVTQLSGTSLSVRNGIVYLKKPSGQ